MADPIRPTLEELAAGDVLARLKQLEARLEALESPAPPKDSAKKKD